LSGNNKRNSNRLQLRLHVAGPRRIWGLLVLQHDLELAEYEEVAVAVVSPQSEEEEVAVAVVSL
jgi:hypothetical protein